MIADTAMLLGKERVTEILNKALDASGAEQTEVVLSTGERSLTRFAGSAIHQNVSERTSHLTVRAIFGKKLGYAASTALDEQSILATVNKAVEFAHNQQENPDFVSLSGPRSVPSCPDTFFRSTAEFGPEDRAGAVGAVIDQAEAKGGEAAGSYALESGELGIVNSLGVEAYIASTGASLMTVVTAGDGFGMATRTAMDVENIDSEAIGKEAAERAEASKSPGSVEAGEYDVVLLPYAVSELLEFLAYLGLGALAVQENRSFMCGKFGQKVCHDSVTIWDDGLDARGIVRPFDAEGVPKQRVDMITNGVANAVVYDSYTAHKEGKQSTGHGVGGTGTHGPFPGNLFLSPGTSSVDEMVASTKRGLLVSRFHYVNPVHPIQTIITGMTRDGTFLIENGKITMPVRNLRFTESILKALSNVEMIGSDLICLGNVTVPALKIRNFRFTGVTEF